MNTIILRENFIPQRISYSAWFLALLFLLWLLVPRFIQFFDPQAGLLDSGIWQVILLALICWLMVLAFSALLSKYLYRRLTLFISRDLNEPLNPLTSWQQHVLYWASFALLVLSATGCLIAIC